MSKSSDAKSFCQCFYFSFLHPKPSGTQVRFLPDHVRAKSQTNLQVSGKTTRRLQLKLAHRARPTILI